jgi:hypothetical protein
MQFTKDTPVKLISFLGKLTAPRNTEARENYWKLIGQHGIVMDDVEMNNGRVLVLFEVNLDDFGVENHNPIKNSLWIKKTDLGVIK